MVENENPSAATTETGDGSQAGNTSETGAASSATTATDNASGTGDTAAAGSSSASETGGEPDASGVLVTDGSDTGTTDETTPPAAVSTEEITYHAVEKDGHVTAIWEMQGRKHLRTIDPRSRQGQEILRLYTSEHQEGDAAPAQGASDNATA